jgi:hypothetical protein
MGGEGADRRCTSKAVIRLALVGFRDSYHLTPRSGFYTPQIARPWQALKATRVTLVYGADLKTVLRCSVALSPPRCCGIFCARKSPPVDVAFAIHFRFSERSRWCEPWHEHRQPASPSNRVLDEQECDSPLDDCRLFVGRRLPRSPAMRIAGSQHNLLCEMFHKAGGVDPRSGVLRW